MQTIITLIIIALAVAFVGRNFVRRWRGKGDACHCTGNHCADRHCAGNHRAGNHSTAHEGCSACPLKNTCEKTA